ncbi:MAG: ABC transporter ATP-binding protein [Bacillaceae bacterium]|nr:ABC transporter ATP-binding protein [Bacillaceae bacterium]
MLKVNHLQAFYGDIQALWDISFEVQEGEIVSLIGANGAGKTTTLKSVAGLIQNKKGEITFKGEDITEKNGFEMAGAGISYVPEGRKVFPQMTVYENLVLGSYNPRAKSDRENMLEQVYQMFPRLKDRHKQHAGTLSGGEQQMLAIGRGLMSKPDILLLDEPSLGIAPILVQEIFEKIKEINQEGMTILLVEQHVHHALELSDRAYVIEHGEIAVSGTAEEMLNDERVREAYLGI